MQIGSRHAMWGGGDAKRWTQIEAVESGTFRLTARYPDVLLSCDSLEPPQVYLQSSLDGGSTWEDFEAGQTEVPLEAG